MNLSPWKATGNFSKIRIIVASSRLGSKIAADGRRFVWAVETRKLKSQKKEEGNPPPPQGGKEEGAIMK